MPIKNTNLNLYTQDTVRYETNLVALELELLQYLGFDEPVDVNYEDICEEYGDVSILEDEHENLMWKELGPVISLQNFPIRTNPFWNMKHNSDNIFNKVDVILFGQETIGSALNVSIL